MPNNLLCHIWPIKRNGAYVRHVEALKQRWSVFDGGVKCVAIVSSPDAASPAEVRSMLPDDCDSFVMSNNPERREVETFEKLFRRVEGKPGRTFYCHAKGVCKVPEEESVIMWTEMMTHVCLDWPELVGHALDKFPLAGCFKRPRCWFKVLGEDVPWHYSGTFFWFDNSRVFCRPDWMRIDQCTHGMETWPCRHFAWEEAACLFDQSHEIPYSLKWWLSAVKPSYQRWAAALRSHGLSMTATSLPPWLEKLQPSFRQVTGRDGTSTTVPVSGNSQDLDLYHHYVWHYLPRLTSSVRRT